MSTAEEGMALALGAARTTEWKARALAWLDQQPDGVTLTADRLVAAVGLADETSESTRNNVVGAWMAAQSKAGRIRWTGTFATSERRAGHGNLQRVWIVHRDTPPEQPSSEPPPRAEAEDAAAARELERRRQVARGRKRRRRQRRAQARLAAAERQRDGQLELGI